MKLEKLPVVYTDENDRHREFGEEGISDVFKQFSRMGLLFSGEKRNVYRKEDNCLIVLTTDELKDLKTSYAGRNVNGQNISFVVPTSDLPLLALSKRTELSLDDNTPLIEELEKGWSYISDKRKVCIPFEEKQKVQENKMETDFANLTLECMNELWMSDEGYIFNIVSNDKKLNIPETIKLSSLFAKTQYNFQIESVDNMISASPVKMDEDIICITSTNDILPRGLTFDIKDGFCSKRNIEELDRFYSIFCSMIYDNLTHNLKVLENELKIAIKKAKKAKNNEEIDEIINKIMDSEITIDRLKEQQETISKFARKFEQISYRSSLKVQQDVSEEKMPTEVVTKEIQKALNEINR